MRRAVLLYNPASGQQKAPCAARVETAAAVLRSAGVEADTEATRAPGSAGAQAREAIARGCDTVIACGGDGTVHETLQGVVGTAATLGVIPLGTANSLAADLCLATDPVKAARQLLAFEAVRIAVGRIEYCDRTRQPATRYFTVAAGIGPDAHLFYRLNRDLKRRFGYAVYVHDALRTWAFGNYPLFEAEFRVDSSAAPLRAEVSQILAVRIANFGGVLRRLAPGAALRSSSLRLVLFRTRSRARYLQYMTAVMLGRKPRVGCIDLVDATSVTCRPLADASRIYAEADGEALARLPVSISVVPDAVTLLVPGQTCTTDLGGLRRIRPVSSF
ncbi:MAG: diacylglycerol kinase family protein [Terriglobales bacterium]